MQFYSVIIVSRVVFANFRKIKTSLVWSQVRSEQGTTVNVQPRVDQFAISSMELSFRPNRVLHGYFLVSIKSRNSL